MSIISKTVSSNSYFLKAFDNFKLYFEPSYAVFTPKDYNLFLTDINPLDDSATSAISRKVFPDKYIFAIS